MSDYERAYNIAAWFANAHERDTCIDQVQMALRVARAEALEEAAQHAERVGQELGLLFLGRMADEIRTLAASPAREQEKGP